MLLSWRRGLKNNNLTEWGLVKVVLLSSKLDVKSNDSIESGMKIMIQTFNSWGVFQKCAWMFFLPCPAYLARKHACWGASVHRKHTCQNAETVNKSFGIETIDEAFALVSPFGIYLKVCLDAFLAVPCISWVSRCFDASEAYAPKWRNSQQQMCFLCCLDARWSILLWRALHFAHWASKRCERCSLFTDRTALSLCKIGATHHCAKRSALSVQKSAFMYHWSTLSVKRKAQLFKIKTTQ